ncbi:hypothetical protein J6590_029367 [Homalodisca vitripennis]|nr:hypothetical protein J6590_029367 [Homalodisca vitripennis]
MSAETGKTIPARSDFKPSSKSETAPSVTAISVTDSSCQGHPDLTLDIYCLCDVTVSPIVSRSTLQRVPFYHLGASSSTTPKTPLLQALSVVLPP